MPAKRKLAKDLKIISKKFLEPKTRKVLLISLRGDKTEWFVWVSQMKGIFKNLDRAEAIKFSGLLLLLEQNSHSQFYQDKIKKFLIERIEFYRYYDFSLEKKIAQEERTRKKLWISKVLRLFISRSFLGILILILIIGFVVWFYTDRESCLEFVQKVIQPFLKAIK